MFNVQRNALRPSTAATFWAVHAASRCGRAKGRRQTLAPAGVGRVRAMDVPPTPPDVVPLPPSPHPVPPSPPVPPEIIEPPFPGRHEPVREPVVPGEGTPLNT